MLCKLQPALVFFSQQHDTQMKNSLLATLSCAELFCFLLELCKNATNNNNSEACQLTAQQHTVVLWHQKYQHTKLGSKLS